MSLREEERSSDLDADLDSDSDMSWLSMSPVTSDDEFSDSGSIVDEHMLDGNNEDEDHMVAGAAPGTPSQSTIERDESNCKGENYIDILMY